MEGIHHGDGKDDHEHTLGVTEVDTIHEHENAINDALIVQVENLKIGSNSEISFNNGGSNIENENGGFGTCNLDREGPIAMSSKSLQKCATFPIGKEEITLESQPESKSCRRCQSLPTERKLISALKGSREKEGVAPRKLSVSWASDVYDPPSTSSSHYPKKKAQQVSKYAKRHGKGKQKGKNVRGGGSGPKEKKHHRKTGGRSARCLDSLADSDRVISSPNKYTSLEILDFDDDINISSPESNSSSNFLGQAGGTMQRVC